MIVEAVRDLIVADVPICAVLSTYVFETGAAAAAAVFTVDPLPKNAEYPAVVITQPSGVQWNTCDEVGAEVDIDVRVFDQKRYGRSSDQLRTLSWDIWKLLNLATFTIPGYSEWGMFCKGPPQQLADEDGFPGYLVPLMVRVLSD